MAFLKPEQIELFANPFILSISTTLCILMIFYITLHQTINANPENNKYIIRFILYSVVAVSGFMYLHNKAHLIKFQKKSGAYEGGQLIARAAETKSENKIEPDLNFPADVPDNDIIEIEDDLGI